MSSEANYLSPIEFSKLAGLSIATVRRRISDRSLPVLQIGGRRRRILIPRDALTSLLSSQATGSHSTTPDIPRPAAPLAGPRPKWARSLPNNKS
jgi:hypothetical protein